MIVIQTLYKLCAKKAVFLLVALAAFVLIAPDLQAATVTSQVDGAWNNTGTWKGGAIPITDEYVFIEHDVTIPDGYTNAPTGLWFTMGVAGKEVSVAGSGLLKITKELWLGTDWTTDNTNFEWADSGRIRSQGASHTWTHNGNLTFATRYYDSDSIGTVTFAGSGLLTIPVMNSWISNSKLEIDRNLTTERFSISTAASRTNIVVELKSGTTTTDALWPLAGLGVTNGQGRIDFTGSNAVLRVADTNMSVAEAKAEINAGNIKLFGAVVTSDSFGVRTVDIGGEDYTYISLQTDFGFKWFEDFEDRAPDTTVNWSPWGPSAATIIAQTNIFSTNVEAVDTNGCYIPASQTLTNSLTISGAHPHLWIDQYVRPYLGEDPPTLDTTAAAQWFFDTNGYIVANNGSVSNWTTYSNTVEGAAATPIATGVWVRLSVFMNYTDKTWGVLVNDQLIHDRIGFIDTSITTFDSFTYSNGPMYIDDVWFSTNKPDGFTSNSLPTLTSDADGDSMPDAWEFDNFGNTAQSGTDDYDDDGSSNAEEYGAGTDPVVAVNTAGPGPFYEDFESDLATALPGAGWHGIISSDTAYIDSSKKIQGSKSLSNNTGTLTFAITGENYTNIWAQFYVMPQAYDDYVAEPSVTAQDICAFYVNTAGVVRAYSTNKWTNVTTTIATVPLNQWVGFATHIDVDNGLWDLYVSTNGSYGESFTRITPYRLGINSGCSATFLSNIVMEGSPMSVDMVAISPAYTNCSALISNVVAFPRVAGALTAAGMPPYDYTNTASANTFAGTLGTNMWLGLALGDQLEVLHTNVWNIYELKDNSGWYWDTISGESVSSFQINGEMGMWLDRGAGTNIVAFYPYGPDPVATNLTGVTVLFDKPTDGWIQLSANQFDEPKFASGSPGWGFANAADWDMIFTDDKVYWYDGNNSRWMLNAEIATDPIVPFQQFWYFRNSGDDFVWTVQ